MEEIIYRVYILRDKNNCITDVWSTGEHALGDTRTEEQMMELGYIKIDDGSDGNIYGYAQVNYLPMKYGKPTRDEKRRCNFSYVDNVHELTEEEKEKFFPPIEPQPTEQDLINADIYMQLAILESQNMPISKELKGVSPRYDLLKKYYDMGIYTKESLHIFVDCGWLTEEEYQEITQESDK